MEKEQIYGGYGIIDRSFRLSLLVITVACLYLPASAKAVGPDRSLDNVVDNWIEVIQTQCNRRLYTQAQESLARAMQYQAFFNEKQQQQINRLSEEIDWAIPEKARLLKNAEDIGRFIDEGKLLKARNLLLEAVESNVLNNEERNRMKLTLRRVEAKIDEQKKLMEDLFKRSRKEYKQGNFEKAGQGFTVVASSGLYVPAIGKTAEEYLAEIGSEQNKTSEHNQTAANSQQVNSVMPIERRTSQTQQKNPSAATSSERFGNIVQRENTDKDNIKKSYVRAVILDAQIKVTAHVGKAEFSLAKAVVQNAGAVLQKYKADIGESLYQQHSDTLQELSRMIEDQQMNWELRWDTKDSGL